MTEQKNQAVLDMLDRLAARLEDVRDVVQQAPIELVGFDKRIDKVDDQLYLVLVSMESTLEQKESYSIPLKEADQPIVSREEAGLEEKKQIITPEMKENLSEAGRSLAAVAKDGKAVVSELTNTMGEFKDLFNFKKPRP